MGDWGAKPEDLFPPFLPSPPVSFPSVVETLPSVLYITSPFSVLAMAVYVWPVGGGS